MRKYLLFFLALLAAPLAVAQFDTAEVLGTVTDASGGALANVTVLLKNQETNVETKTNSDPSGNYDFVNVKVGRYTISAQVPGFETFTTTDVVVTWARGSVSTRHCK
jgi:hypothetical protein